LQLIQVLKDVIVACSKVKSIVELCLHNQPPYPNYSVHDQLCFLKGRLVIPSNNMLIEQILGE